MSDTSRDIYKKSYPDKSQADNSISVDSEVSKTDDGDVFQQKMQQTRRMSMFLNFNAIVLLSVFIVCYAVFA